MSFEKVFLEYFLELERIKDASSADQEKVQASTMPSSAKLRQMIPAINASKN